MIVEAAIIAGIQAIRDVTPRRFTDDVTGARLLVAAGYLFVSLGEKPDAEQLLDVVRRCVSPGVAELIEMEPGYFVASRD